MAMPITHSAVIRAATLEPRTQPFAVDEIVARVKTAAPEASVASYELLTATGAVGALCFAAWALLDRLRPHP